MQDSQLLLVQVLSEVLPVKAPEPGKIRHKQFSVKGGLLMFKGFKKGQFHLLLEFFGFMTGLFFWARENVFLISALFSS